MSVPTVLHVARIAMDRARKCRRASGGIHACTLSPSQLQICISLPDGNIVYYFNGLGALLFPLYLSCIVSASSTSTSILSGDSYSHSLSHI